MRKNRVTLLSLTVLLLIMMLACNLTPGSVVPTDTPGVVLPPPAMAVLKVVYAQGGNLWLWTEGGSPLQLTFSGSDRNPRLSSDGQLVAFLRGGELWVVQTDGSGERVLVDAAMLAPLIVDPGSAIEVSDMRWVPGFHIVLFNTLLIAGEAGYHLPQLDLLSTHADASPATMVQLRAAGEGGIPYVSPDGMHIALAQPGKVIFLEQSGAFLREALTFAPALTYSEWSYVPELVWLPDSSAVRLVAPAHDPLLDPTEVSTFWHVPVTGSPAALTTFVAAPIFFSFPYLSPNGSTVAYMSESGGSVTIHTITEAGADVAFFTFPGGSAGLTGWSPDSLHFMYWTPDTRTEYLAGTDLNLLLGDTPYANRVRWVDPFRYLYLNDQELRFTTLYAPSVALDNGVSEFDFVMVVY